MTAPQSPDGPPISRRALLQGAGALGLSAAGSTWLTPARALAGSAPGVHSGAQPPLLSAEHLVANYLPSQPTGWPPQQGQARNGVGVTIGGHVASVQFTLRGTAYEVRLLAFGQPGNAPDPVYEGEPSDPTIDFKRTLERAWGAYFSFRYLGGFSGRSAISVHSYSAVATERIEATATRVSYGCDLLLVYEPDPTTTDPPLTADLRWIQVTHAQGRSSTEFHQRANPFYFPGGLTSVYGKPACSFYGAPAGGIAVPKRGVRATGAGPTFSSQEMSESFLVLDTGRKDHAGKGIIDILGGVKWGFQVQPAAS